MNLCLKRQFIKLVTNRFYLDVISMCVTVSIATFLVFFFIAVHVLVSSAIASFLPEGFKPNIPFPMFELCLSFICITFFIVLTIPSILLNEIMREKENKFESVNWQRDGF